MSIRDVRAELIPAGLVELEPAPGEPDRPEFPLIRRAMVATIEWTWYELSLSRQPAGA